MVLNDWYDLVIHKGYEIVGFYNQMVFMMDLRNEYRKESLSTLGLCFCTMFEIYGAERTHTLVKEIIGAIISWSM